MKCQFCGEEYTEEHILCVGDIDGEVEPIELPAFACETCFVGGKKMIMESAMTAVKQLVGEIK